MRAYRQTQGWLLLTQQMLIIHLIGIAPWWTLLLMNGAVCWQLGVYLNKLPRPSGPALFVLTLGASLGLLPYAISHGMAPALAILIAVGFSLKSLEVNSRRDMLTLVLVAFFLITLSLIHQYSALKLLSALALMLLSLAVLISLHRAQSATANLKFAIKLMAISVPLTLVLFMVLPKPQLLWSANLQHSAATTGLSQRLELGDISQLNQSDELAFVAQFTQAPDPTELYWRVYLLTHFDGKQWHGPPSIAAPLPKPQFSTQAQPVTYRITHWDHSQDNYPNLKGSHNLNDAAIALIGQQWRRQYGATQSPRFSYLPQADRLKRLSDHYYLQLPDGMNPQTRSLAKLAMENRPLTSERVLWLMNYFQQNDFQYTFSPRLLGSHQIDDFLFESREGFCAHFASALVVLLRASGIPARMVVGYYGGEINDNEIVVKQKDAHAWVEAWVTGRWIQLDPTSTVGEINRPQTDPADFDWHQFTQSWQQWLSHSSASHWLTSSSSWQQLNQDLQPLKALWHQLTGAPRHWQLALLSLMLVSALLYLYRRTKGSEPVKLRLIKALATRGWQRLHRSIVSAGLTTPTNGSLNQVMSAAKQRWPELTEDFQHIESAFNELLYRADGAHWQGLLTFFKRLTALLPKLSTSSSCSNPSPKQRQN